MLTERTHVKASEGKTGYEGIVTFHVVLTALEPGHTSQTRREGLGFPPCTRGCKLALPVPPFLRVPLPEALSPPGLVRKTESEADTRHQLHPCPRLSPAPSLCEICLIGESLSYQTSCQDIPRSQEWAHFMLKLTSCCLLEPS